LSCPLSPFRLPTFSIFSPPDVYASPSHNWAAFLATATWGFLHLQPFCSYLLSYFLLRAPVKMVGRFPFSMCLLHFKCPNPEGCSVFRGFPLFLRQRERFPLYPMVWTDCAQTGGTTPLVFVFSFEMAAPYSFFFVPAMAYYLWCGLSVCLPQAVPFFPRL